MLFFVQIQEKHVFGVENLEFCLKSNVFCPKTLAVCQNQQISIYVTEKLFCFLSKFKKNNFSVLKTWNFV